MKCLNLLTQVACAYCDPDVRTGIATGLCRPYADELFAECKDMYLDAY